MLGNRIISSLWCLWLVSLNESHMSSASQDNLYILTRRTCDLRCAMTCHRGALFYPNVATSKGFMCLTVLVAFSGTLYPCSRPRTFWVFLHLTVTVVFITAVSTPAGASAGSRTDQETWLKRPLIQSLNSTSAEILKVFSKLFKKGKCWRMLKNFCRYCYGGNWRDKSENVFACLLMND